MLNPKKTKKQRQYLRNNMTKWEVRLWSDLKGKQMFGFKVRRQYGIDNLVIDFYCPELKLALEVDGDVHYYPDKAEMDKRKDKRLHEEGIQLIRLKNEDLEEDYDSTVIYLEDKFKARAYELHKPLKVDLD
jgi:very-short-patch-repair endonuclease